MAQPSRAACRTWASCPAPRSVVVRRAPLGDPVEIELRGYRLCLRLAQLDSALRRSRRRRRRRSGRERGAGARAPCRSGSRWSASPNAGKTTLFNALTGSAARVGNYPGVTVERREGELRRRDARRAHPRSARHVLPRRRDARRADRRRRCSRDAFAGEAIPDALIVVADATTLQRGLGLVREVLRLGLPTLARADHDRRGARRAAGART